MRIVSWLTAASVAAWLVATWLGSPGPEVLAGMLGPLVVTAGSWILTERIHRRKPGQLTAVMIAAFGAKLVFFGAYVAVMLKVVAVRPVPFVVSFTSYFIALHVAEAVSLQRLLAGDIRASR